MKKEFVRNPYNYDSDLVSDETGLRCPEPTLTKQEFLEESDINYIAERFLKTGEVQQTIDMPEPGDFQGIFDFQSAMNIITDAKNEFMKLPAKVRNRFENDPAKLLDFIDNIKDDDDRAEAIRLGLIDKPKVTHEPERSETTPREPQSRSRTARAATGSDPAPGPEEPGPKATEADR